MKILGTLITACAIASVIPYKVTKSEEDGTVKAKALIYDLSISKGENGETKLNVKFFEDAKKAAAAAKEKAVKAYEDFKAKSEASCECACDESKECCEEKEECCEEKEECREEKEECCEEKEEGEAACCTTDNKECCCETPDAAE